MKVTITLPNDQLPILEDIASEKGWLLDDSPSSTPLIACEPEVAYSSQSLSSDPEIVALRNERKQWRARIQELAALRQDWDDENADPIVPSLLKLIEDFLPLTTTDILAKWWLFPAPNGSLSLSPEGEQRAAVSIGTNGITAFARRGPYHVSSSVTASPQNLSALLTFLTNVYC
ncbi:MAG: hypothetical protein LIP03_12870 [Bacteroidales bacterium]|nr:hypothetical protein [Bacteroidales bacterium]